MTNKAKQKDEKDTQTSTGLIKDRSDGKKNEDLIQVERFSEEKGNQLYRKKDPLSREQSLLWNPKEENERSREKDMKIGGKV